MYLPSTRKSLCHDNNIRSTLTDWNRCFCNRAMWDEISSSERYLCHKNSPPDSCLSAMWFTVWCPGSDFSRQHYSGGSSSDDVVTGSNERSHTIHTRWSSSCGACHLSREAGALDRLGPFFYLVLVTASVQGHHLTSSRLNMVSCANRNRNRRENNVEKDLDTLFPVFNEKYIKYSCIIDLPSKETEIQ